MISSRITTLIRTIFFLQVLVVFSTNISIAQESIVPLGTNPVLIQASKFATANLSNSRISTFNDTLTLPFIDDFSKRGIYPFDSLWLDSNVFINSNYGDLPITIGVATFDGLNKNGYPYNPSASQDSVADFLTSRPIDLAVLTGDTSVWLSFFYQPQGLGDVPETKDSLVLQLRDTGGVWNNVWALKGNSDTAFKRANIHLLDNKYFYKGFQFRFYNIATVNGNRDHWNIDYVILRRFAAPNDSILDNALIYPQTSLLNEFTAMPYTHYKFLGAQIPLAVKSMMNDTIHDINYGPTSYSPQIEISQNGGSIFNGNTGTISSISSQSYIPYSIPLGGFTYPTQPGDSADFLVKSYFSQTGAPSNRDNDTSYFTQHFHNYYSYDDGSAEVAYGITGNTDISMAYKFDVKMQDTLVGMQIYFNPVGVDVSLKLFSLAVWTSVDVASNTANLLYSRIDQRPGVNDSINGFKSFTFDSTLIVGPGVIYVGMIQSEPATIYGVGLDRNTDSRSKMFYHLDGYWRQSNIKGSWMIRPIFGKRISVVGVDQISNHASDFEIYPNPANDHITVNLFSEKNSTIQIIDLLGQVKYEEVINGQKSISTQNFSKGIYFLRVIYSNNFSSVKKFIID